MREMESWMFGVRYAVFSRHSTLTYPAAVCYTCCRRKGLSRCRNQGGNTRWPFLCPSYVGSVLVKTRIDVIAAHTGIGIISQLIAAIERHPHTPLLEAESPLVAFISCAADFAPKIPNKLKKAIRRVEASLDHSKGKKPKVDKKALKEVEDWWVEGSVSDGTLSAGEGKALVSTTQAVDIINGGVKVNALVCRLYICLVP